MSTCVSEDCLDQFGEDRVEQPEIAARDEDEAEHDAGQGGEGLAVRPLDALKLGPDCDQELYDTRAVLVCLGVARRAGRAPRSPPRRGPASSSSASVLGLRPRSSVRCSSLVVRQCGSSSMTVSERPSSWAARRRRARDRSAAARGGVVAAAVGSPAPGVAAPGASAALAAASRRAGARPGAASPADGHGPRGLAPSAREDGGRQRVSLCGV